MLYIIPSAFVVVGDIEIHVQIAHLCMCVILQHVHWQSNDLAGQLSVTTYVCVCSTYAGTDTWRLHALTRNTRSQYLIEATFIYCFIYEIRK